MQALEKEGIVDYLWPLPNTTEPLQKRSYVKGFLPWKWIVGTGIYITDTKKMIDEVNSIINSLWITLFVLVIISGLLTAITIISMNKRFKIIFENLKKYTNCDFTNTLNIDYTDDIGLILIEINKIIRSHSIIKEPGFEFGGVSSKGLLIGGGILVLVMLIVIIALAAKATSK